jgi:hypothetical protein
MNNPNNSEHELFEYNIVPKHGKPLHRGTMETFHDILEAIHKNPDINKTNIMYRSRLSWITLGPYLDYLLSHEYVITSTDYIFPSYNTEGIPQYNPQMDNPSRTQYRLTQSGVYLLSMLDSCEIRLGLKAED